MLGVFMIRVVAQQAFNSTVKLAALQATGKNPSPKQLRREARKT